MMRTVLKLGCSLISVSKDLINYLIEAHVDALVVPGGWPFAETVLRYTAHIDETAANWMAVSSI